jgi:tRNA pseudouridine38-40 synthase
MDRTVCARIHYDGRGFAGWQIQPGGRTVQGELEAVLGRLCSTPIRAHGAGRTDAGVHALGMAVSAVVPAKWTPVALQEALNALLPTDIWVERLEEVRPGFHARMSAGGRSYCYRIGTDAGSRSPFRRPYEWGLRRELDGDLLASLAAVVSGPHDFRALAVHTGLKRNCRCDIRRARWVRRAGNTGWEFHVAADRFLHHMVRILVGTMVDAATARRPPGDLARLLAEDPGVRASPPAPAEGLYFMAAEYPDHWFRLGESPE